MGKRRKNRVTARASAAAGGGANGSGGSHVGHERLETFSDAQLAANFCAEAIFERAGHLALGQHDARQNDTEAARLLRLAADKGHSGAEYNLGLCYAEGHGVAQDFVEAAELYRRAAASGHAEALVNLGNLYHAGNGVEQSDQKAARLYKRAAKQGHAVAQYNLGVQYEEGKGVRQDFARAAELYRRAASQGHGNAHNNLAILLEQGTGVERNLVEAARYYTLAAEKGVSEACVNLAQLYKLGVVGGVGSSSAGAGGGEHGKGPLDIPIRSTSGNTGDPSAPADACSSCGAQGVPMKVCARCRGPRYCGAACQKADWAAHKTVCEKAPPPPASVATSDSNDG